MPLQFMGLSNASPCLYKGRGCVYFWGMIPTLDDAKRERVRALRRHTMASNRSRVTLVPSLSPASARVWSTACGDAMAWLLPWHLGEYPGVKAGVLELLAGRAGWQAFKMWRAGSRTMPEWFACLLADLIEARSREGLSIAQRLRDYRAPVYRNRGAMAVDPLTGRDGRGGRIGKRRKNTE